MKNGSVSVSPSLTEYVWVRSYFQTSPGAQKHPTIQAGFQRWFMEKVRFYQGILSDTALDKGNPDIIDLGDFSNLFQRYFGKPGEKGKYRIFFPGPGLPSLQRGEQNSTCFYRFTEFVWVCHRFVDGEGVVVKQSS
jgi:hypothetical protein